MTYVVRAFPRGFRRRGQGAKYGSHEAYYRTGTGMPPHPRCEPGKEWMCGYCKSRAHHPERTKNARLHCVLCADREREAPYWYQSRAEANTAKRLDRQLADREIAAWRRARPVVLLPEIPGQKPIRYTADFYVVALNGTPEVLEVKGSAFVIADDARLKIKMYRAVALRCGWPPLRVVTGSGKPIAV